MRRLVKKKTSLRQSFKKIDKLESILANQVQVHIPVVHRFTKGMYIREVTIPAGTILTSKIHKTQHPYVISKGKISVLLNDKCVCYEAPYTGITEPNTRRVLYAHEETVWTTFHPNPDDVSDLGVLEAKLIEPHEIHSDELETDISMIKSILETN